MAQYTLHQVMQTLQQGWGKYVQRFQALSPEVQVDFLEDQGFEDFHDLLAHIVGWWEEGLRIITGILDGPGFQWEERDTDTFNQELVEKYRSWSEADLFLHFDNVRDALLGLVADVIEHLEDHHLP